MSDTSEAGTAALVSTSAAARAVGVSQPTLSRWVAAGLITPTQRTLGGHMRWDVTDLRAQLRKAGALPADPHGRKNADHGGGDTR